MTTEIIQIYLKEIVVEFKKKLVPIITVAKYTMSDTAFAPSRLPPDGHEAPKRDHMHNPRGHLAGYGGHVPGMTVSAKYHHITMSL